MLTKLKAFLKGPEPQTVSMASYYHVKNQNYFLLEQNKALMKRNGELHGFVIECENKLWNPWEAFENIPPICEACKGPIFYNRSTDDDYSGRAF